MWRQTIEALLNPVCVIFLIMLIASIIKRSKILALASMLFWLASSGFVPSMLTNMLESPYKIIKNANPSIKAIVVLSGGQAHNKDDYPASQMLYSASLKRLLEGIRLYRQIPDATLILSGGGYQLDIPEAIGLNEVAGLCQIPVNSINLEQTSLNTLGQAQKIVPIVKQKPFYLVTSAIHMSRSLYLFKKEGLNPIPAPCDFTFYWQDERWQKFWLPNGNNLMYLSIALHEIMGSIYNHVNPSRDR